MDFAASNGSGGGIETDREDWVGTVGRTGEQQQQQSMKLRVQAGRPSHLQIAPANNVRGPPSPTNYSRVSPSPTSSQHSVPLYSPKVESPTSTPANSVRSTSLQTVASDKPYRTSSDASSRKGPALRPSEASRLRVLNFNSTASGGRQTPDMLPMTENFSRPRKHSIKTSEDSQRPVLVTANTFPRQHHPDEQVFTSSIPLSRERGVSTASSVSSNQFPAVPLRPSNSIPDFSTIDSVHTRQRNVSNISLHRPGKPHDSIASSFRRELPPRTNGICDDEIRASFRSALTATSSFVGTSGTERSSVLTKSSSATSIYGREEGMSVDDAIGMYENGFQDSDAEGGMSSRPATSHSQRSALARLPDALSDTLGVPTVPDLDGLAPPSFPQTIIRDSTQIFTQPFRGSLDDRSARGDDDLTPRQLQHPVSSHSYGGISSLVGDSRPNTGSPGTGYNFDDSRDRYGFKKASQHVSRAQYDEWNTSYLEHLARRRKKWVALMKEAGLSSDNPSVFPPKSTKMKRFVRKGIPPSWRGAAWFHYAGGPAILEKHPRYYDSLLQRVTAELKENEEEQIERDLHRTFPDNIRFKPDPIISSVADPTNNRSSLRTLKDPETPILQSLRRVLQAFAIHAPKIGYCQSLNFLAGLLLLFVDSEEKAFWMLVIITHVYLPGTHEVSLEGANVDLGVLMTSIRESMPQIWAKIGGELDGSLGVDTGKISMRLPPITLCCTAWFMSCFIGTLPIESTLRVWDSFFYEGSKTIFRIALAIFKTGEAEIKSVNDPMEIFQVVQTIPRKLIDANALMEVCWRRRNGFGHLSQDTIEKGREIRRKGYAEERARARGEVVPSGGVTGNSAGGTLGRKGTLFRRRKKGMQAQSRPETGIPDAV